ncbi:tyrosine-type recombinase/integrase [Psychroserpens sp. Hel_I_66]|uniref:tyrosine-type recombinase/integrase n=1 Tax=Psychroserpens sp. Hel_I_66 TaxID=1250004 RepID=UPI00064760D0|nr:phage integrase SAM-like domain-containing protein [Psychroserpens sp. Hel_I_66]
MTIKFFIVKGKKKYSSIYIRFWDSNRIDQKVRTGINVEPKNWSISKQRIKINSSTLNVDILNSQLSKLEKFIFDNYNLEYNTSKHISKIWLKENVSIFFNRTSVDESSKVYFVDWVELFVKGAEERLFNGAKLKKRSLNNYSTTLSKLQAFENHSKQKLRFEDIDLTFHSKFISYCVNEEKLSNNTIGSIVSRIKTFCRNAEMDGLPINPKYKHRDFNLPKNDTIDTYLNDEEINLIYNHDFSSSERLDNTRDLFVIGLRTGLRISDLLRISKENIFNNVINITTHKTNQNLTIPIHPQFKSILEKREGKLPPKISSQKFNIYIKEICRDVGINQLTPGYKMDPETKRKKFDHYPKYELITSHSCRRSFCSVLFLSGDIDNSTIMAATGHKSIAQFTHYVKASQDEHIKKISEYWDRQNNKFDKL